MHERNKVLVNPLIKLGQPPIPEIPFAAGARAHREVGHDDISDPHVIIIRYENGQTQGVQITGNLKKRQEKLNIFLKHEIGHAEGNKYAIYNGHHLLATTELANF